jgi:zinc transport system substrate-binding protein
VKTRIALTLVALSLLPGCGGDSGDDGGVVAAFYPLAFAAEEIAGPGTEVRNLTPPGVEPHDFELSGRDVEAVAAADTVLYLGQGFQPALEDAVESTGANGLDLLEGLELLAEPAGHGHGDEEAEPEPDGDRDPHVWLDPTLYASIVERIGAALDRPEAAGRLSARLADLDTDFEAGLENCERRELVTSHTAFGYLAERYGLEQVGIVELDPEAEPSPARLREIGDVVREHGVTTIFSETLVSPKVAETLAADLGVGTATLDPLEGLADDAPTDGSGQADYESVMRANLAALQEGLACS